MSPRPHRALSIQQAAAESATLASLSERLVGAQNRLELSRKVLPGYLAQVIVAGPLQGSEWCLLVPNPAIAAKLRQLLPRLLGHLNQQGLATDSIRIKVLVP